MLSVLPAVAFLAERRTTAKMVCGKLQYRRGVTYCGDVQTTWFNARETGFALRLKGVRILAVWS